MPSITDLLAKKKNAYSEKAWGALLQEQYDRYKDKSYYELFGVSHPIQESNESELKKNYRKLCLIVHPDKNRGKSYERLTQELFELIGSAYAVLIDKEKEREYYLQKQPQQTFHKRSAPEEVPVYHRHSTCQTNDGRFTRDRRLEGDIKKGKKISSHIGKIHITGNIYGTVENIQGNIEIHGDVYGTVINHAGEIRVYGDLKPGGLLRNISSNIYLAGRAEGIISNPFGFTRQGDIDKQKKTEKNAFSQSRHSFFHFKESDHGMPQEVKDMFNSFF
jgi:curved DNA-binding protein CbpA